ncbi:endonuclease/exonuclease/phosphatase family protein [Aquimarina sp. RZ0]|uniref:endonuclease/exonuclease/phosphatase family protein n=1 Tax=Aquimarina sp. RZ0 TaxID=2607730 RepID=UPI0011F2212B|nr:endonuclease/exonuclease/phosphatase family protein [Aquimarina sp. RZ0]KAA1245804.1 endonuclease/exonuclease/phosphatase family protein [Aquimarina sp. RZ0]
MKYNHLETVKKLNTSFSSLLRIPFLVMFGISMLIHFVIKDHIYPISILYYASAPLLLIVGGLILSILFFEKKKVFYLLIFTSLCLICYWITNYYNSLSTSVSTNFSKTILFWNIGRSKEVSFRILLKEVQDKSPNIIGMVEAKGITDENIKEFKDKFPNYDMQKLGGDMVVAVKGRIDTISHFSKTASFKFNEIHFTSNNEKRSVLIADINAIPFGTRSTALDSIYKFAIKNNSSFIMGDFNTPYESVYFDDFRKNLQSFHSVATGFTATWPYGVPLLEIDQIWSNKNIQPVLLEKKYYKVSDHALLTATYQ